MNSISSVNIVISVNRVSSENSVSSVNSVISVNSVSSVNIVSSIDIVSSVNSVYKQFIPVLYPSPWYFSIFIVLYFSAQGRVPFPDPAALSHL